MAIFCDTSLKQFEYCREYECNDSTFPSTKPYNDYYSAISCLMSLDSHHDNSNFPSITLGILKM